MNTSNQTKSSMDWGSIALGGANLIGSILSQGAASQQARLMREINQQNIAMQRETNELNRQMFYDNLDYQSAERKDQNEVNWENAVKMFNLENTYNSPAEQMQRLVDAGLNPAAAAKDVGLSSASSPVSSSNVGASNPNLVAPHAMQYETAGMGFLKNVNTLASAIGQIAGASAQFAQGSSIRQKLTHEIDKIISENEKIKSETFGQDLSNALVRRYGDKKAESEINEKIANIAQKYADCDRLIYEGDYYHSKQLLTDVEKDVALIDKDMKSKDRDNWKEFWNLKLSKMRGEIGELRSRAFEQWTQGQSNKVLTEYYTILGRGQQIQNDLLQNEKAFQEQTFQDRVQRYFYDTDAHFYGSLEQKQAADEAKSHALEAMKHNNYWEFSYWFEEFQ